MQAIKDDQRRHRAGWKALPALRVCAVLSVGIGAAAIGSIPFRSPAAAAGMDAANQTCAPADDATAAGLMEQWTLAIKSQHPDHVARLFAPDATLLGFASPSARANYAQIRAYYLYYFQFSPQVKLEDRQLQIGCNYMIQTGNYAWSLKSKKSVERDIQPARYRIVFEHSATGWQFAEHVEELTGPHAASDAYFVPEPQEPRVAIITSKTGAAVAGFLKRIAGAAPVSVQKPLAKPLESKAPAVVATPRPTRILAPAEDKSDEKLQAPSTPSHLGLPRGEAERSSSSPAPARIAPSVPAVTLRQQRWRTDAFQGR